MARVCALARVPIKAIYGATAAIMATNERYQFSGSYITAHGGVTGVGRICKHGAELMPSIAVKDAESGHHIAAYLGKAEPNDYLTAWGKTKRNHLKQRRRCKGGEGPIEGTSKHHYRWGTSLAVGRTQRDRNGFYSN